MITSILPYLKKSDYNQEPTHTFHFNGELVGLVDDSLLQARSVSAAFGGVADLGHIDVERRTRHRHVVVEDVDLVLAFLERRVADAVGAVSLGSDDLLGDGAARVADGAGDVLALAFRSGYSPRIDRKLVRLE